MDDLRKRPVAVVATGDYAGDYWVNLGRCPEPECGGGLAPWHEKLPDMVNDPLWLACDHCGDIWCLDDSEPNLDQLVVTGVLIAVATFDESIEEMAGAGV